MYNPITHNMPIPSMHTNKVIKCLPQNMLILHHQVIDNEPKDDNQLLLFLNIMESLVLEDGGGGEGGVGGGLGGGAEGGTAGDGSVGLMVDEGNFGGGGELMGDRDDHLNKSYNSYESIQDQNNNKLIDTNTPNTANPNPNPNNPPNPKKPQKKSQKSKQAPSQQKPNRQSIPVSTPIYNPFSLSSQSGLKKLQKLMSTVIEHCDRVAQTRQVHKVFFLVVKYLYFRAVNKNRYISYLQAYSSSNTNINVFGQDTVIEDNFMNKQQLLEWLTDAAHLFAQQLQYPPFDRVYDSQRIYSDPSKQNIKKNSQRLKKLLQIPPKAPTPDPPQSQYFTLPPNPPPQHKLSQTTQYFYLLHLVQQNNLQQLLLSLQKLIIEVNKIYETKFEGGRYRFFYQLDFGRVEGEFQGDQGDMGLLVLVVDRIRNNVIANLSTIIDVVIRILYLRKQVKEANSNSSSRMTKLQQQKFLQTQAKLNLPAPVLQSIRKQFSQHDLNLQFNNNSNSSMKSNNKSIFSNNSMFSNKINGSSSNSNQKNNSNSSNKGRMDNINKSIKNKKGILWQYYQNYQQLQVVFRYIIGILLGDQPSLTAYCSNNIYLQLKLQLLYTNQPSTHHSPRAKCIDYLQRTQQVVIIESEQSDEEMLPNERKLADVHRLLLGLISIVEPLEGCWVGEGIGNWQLVYHYLLGELNKVFTGYPFYSQLLTTFFHNLKLINKQLYLLDQQYESNLTQQFLLTCQSHITEPNEIASQQFGNYMHQSEQKLLQRQKKEQDEYESSIIAYNRTARVMPRLFGDGNPDAPRIIFGQPIGDNFSGFVNNYSYSMNLPNMQFGSMQYSMGSSNQFDMGNQYNANSSSQYNNYMGGVAISNRENKESSSNNNKESSSNKKSSSNNIKKSSSYNNNYSNYERGIDSSNNMNVQPFNISQKKSSSEYQDYMNNRGQLQLFHNSQSNKQFQQRNSSSQYINRGRSKYIDNMQLQHQQSIKNSQSVRFQSKKVSQQDAQRTIQGKLNKLSEKFNEHISLVKSKRCLYMNQIKLLLCGIAYYKNILYKTNKYNQLYIKYLMQTQPLSRSSRPPKPPTQPPPPAIQQPTLPQSPSSLPCPQLKIMYGSLPLHQLIDNLLPLILEVKQVRSQIQMFNLRELANYACYLDVMEYFGAYLRVLAGMHWGHIGEVQMGVAVPNLIDIYAIDIVMLEVEATATLYKIYQTKSKPNNQLSPTQQQQTTQLQSFLNNQQYTEYQSLFQGKNNQLNYEYNYYSTYAYQLFKSAYLTAYTLNIPFNYDLLNKVRDLNQNGGINRYGEGLKDFMEFFQVYFIMESVTKRGTYREQGNINNNKPQTLNNTKTANNSRIDVNPGPGQTVMHTQNTEHAQTNQIPQVPQSIKNLLGRMDTMIGLMSHNNPQGCGEVLRVIWEVMEDYQLMESQLVKKLIRWHSDQEQKLVDLMNQKMMVLIEYLSHYIMIVEAEGFTNAEFYKFKEMLAI